MREDKEILEELEKIMGTTSAVDCIVVELLLDIRQEIRNGY